MSTEDTLTQVVDTLKQATDVQPQLDALMKQVGNAPDDIEEFFGQLQGKLEGLKGTLPEIDRQNINDNLEALRSRLPNYQQEITDSLAALGTRSSEIVSVVQQQVDTTVEEAKPLLTKVGDGLEKAADIFPEKLTKNMDRNAKIALSVGTGAAVVASVLFVGKWLAKRTDKAAKAGNEAARKTKGSLFKKVMVGLGVGALAFGSLKLYTLYKKYGNMMDAMSAWGTQIKEGGAIVNETVSDALGLNEDSEVVSNDVETPPHFESEDLMRSSEILSRNLSASGLLIMHRSLAEEAGINFANSREPEIVSDVLSNSDIASIPVAELRQINSVEGARALVNNRLQADQPKLSALQEKAVLFLAKVCQVELEKPAINTLLKKTNLDVQTMTLEQLIALTGPNATLFAKFGSVFSKENPFSEATDIRTVTSAVFSPDTSAHELANHPVIADRAVALHAKFSDKNILSQFAFYCFAPGQSGERSLKDLAGNIDGADTENERVFREALHTVQGVINDPEAREYLRQFAQGNPENEAVITAYLNEDVSVEDALQLYMYLQMAQQDNAEQKYPSVKESDASSALMLQMKMLNIVSKKNNRQAIIMRDELIASMASGTLNLPDGTNDMLKNMLSISAQHTLGWVVDLSVRAWDEVSTAFITVHKDEYLRFPALAGDALVGRFIYKWATRDWPDIMINRLGGKSWLEWAPRKIPYWSRFTESGRLAWNPARMSAVADEMVHLDNLVKGVSNVDDRKALTKAWQAFNKRGYSKASFSKFYKEMAALRKSGRSLNVIKEVVQTVNLWDKNGLGPAMQKRRFNILQRMARFVPATAGKTLKAGKETVNVTAKTFSAFMKQFDALRKSTTATGKSLKLMLLKNIVTIRRAAQGGNRMASGLLKTARWLRLGGKGAARAVPALGVILDGVLITANEIELRDAVSKGEHHKAEALRGKRSSLAVGGGAGLAMLSANPATIALAAPVLAGSMYANSIYDSIVTWERSKEDWMQYSNEDLITTLKERKLGYADIGQRAGAGYSGAYSLWRWGRSWTTAGAEKNKQEDEAQYELVEGVNENVRQEILAAYLTKNLKFAQVPGESEQEQKARMTQVVNDAISYVKSATNGTYWYPKFVNMERELGLIQSYTELMEMKRTAQAEGLPPQLDYSWDGEQKTLDLSTLAYVHNPAAKVDSMDFYKTIHQYQTEVAVVRDSIAEISAMDISDELAAVDEEG